jgi:hypothetical protein
MKLGTLFSKTSKPTAQNFVLRSYTRDDGSFDYERYRATQEAGNKNKLGNCWVMPGNMAYLADYLKKRLGNVQFGICHGTRRGLEQQWLREHLGCEVIGTEISETATQFPHTIQWDFHEVKPEWIGKADFIYSNSFDHSYDPGLCINRWMSCLRPGGLCVLEHTSAHEPDCTSQLDPFGAPLAIMPYLILEWSKGLFAVQEILDAPEVRKEVSYVKFLVLRHNER